MRPTIEFLDIFDQVRELTRVEFSLVRAEISGIPSSLTAVVVGIVLLPVALGRSSRRLTGSLISAGPVQTKEPLGP
jgi:hypothetical protein